MFKTIKKRYNGVKKYIDGVTQKQYNLKGKNIFPVTYRKGGDSMVKKDKSAENWIKATNLGEQNLYGFPITMIHVEKCTAAEARREARRDAREKARREREA